MRTPAFVLLAALCVACTDDHEGSVHHVATIDDAPLVAGRVHVYAFEWTVDAEAHELGLLPDGAPLQAQIELTGELGVRVVRAAGGATELAVAIRRLDRHGISLYGRDVIPSADVLIGPEAFVTLDAGTDAREVVFDRDTPPLLRHVMAGLLAQIDLTVGSPGDARWRAEVPASNGLARVEYALDESGNVHRELLDYTRLDAVGQHTGVSVSGSADMSGSADGLPRTITAHEQLRATGIRGEHSVFESDTHFSMRRVGEVAGPVGGWPAVDRIVAVDLTAAPSDVEAQRELARKFAGDLTIDDVERVVRSVDHGLLPRPGFMVAATGLLRASPELAAALVPMFEQTDDGGARSVVMDILASAGTPESQRTMIELLSAQERRDEPAFVAWLQRFSFVVHPIPESATFLVALAEDTVGQSVGRAALFPLGSVARRVVPESPLVGALAHRVLLDALERASDPDDSIAALAGLGNEAHDDSLESLLAYVDHHDFGVRLQVASALRNQTDERARAALFELLRDEDDAVARVALVSLADHPLGGDPASSLAAVGLAGAFNPAIAGALVGELGRRVDEGPEVRQALARLGDTSQDARLRARVDAVLAL